MCHSHLDVGDVIVTARGNYVEITAENADGSVSAVFVSHQDMSKIGDTVRYASHGGHVLCAGGDGVCRHHDDDTQYTVAVAGQPIVSRLWPSYHRDNMVAARDPVVTAKMVENMVRGDDRSVTVSAVYRVADRMWVVYVMEPVSQEYGFATLPADRLAGAQELGVMMRNAVRARALRTLGIRPAAEITIENIGVDETKDERARLPALTG